jgi:hypothetical protein
MTFAKMAVWVRVLDLPLDMMNKVFGKIIGNWVGKFLSVDVDDDGVAWGKELRIRVEIRVDKPLLRGVILKESEDDVEGKWFDLKYEKIPHFCFDCGMLFHTADGCKAEEEEVQQWGEWLRASPGRSRKPPPAHRPSVSTASYSSRSADTDTAWGDRVWVRDLPTKRNLFRAHTQADSGSSHTGGNDHRRREKEVTCPTKHHWVPQDGKGKDPAEVAAPHRRARPGTYVRKERKNSNPRKGQQHEQRSSPSSKKRTMQVWLPVGVSTIGEAGDTSNNGKKQKVASVFDRISDPNFSTASPARRDRRAQ